MFSSRSAPAHQGDGHKAAPTVAVEDLRVGMFIHLDGGWLSHPFSLSSFRIANAQQITTLQGLKLGRVRWSPELSDSQLPAGRGLLPGAADNAASSAAPPSPGPGVSADAMVDAIARTSADTSADASADASAGTSADTSADARAEAAMKRVAAVAGQRETQRRCEAHFAEATAAWREASGAISSHPERAAAGAAALARSLTDKLMTDGDVGIRLLPMPGNDRAAAHALNVSVVATLLGRTLGLAREELGDLALGSLLHDIGKLELPERARHLETGCSAAEMQAYRDHVTRGVAAARRMGLPEGALTVIAQHHEHADGSGFPQRIGGDRLMLASRIVAIVDRYDNLCNPATRMPPLTPHEAVATMFAQGRQRDDAAVLNTFIRMMGVYPAGSLVQLTDERFAMVMSVNASRPLKPRVLVHDGKVPRSEALLLDLELEPDLGIRRSLTAAKMPEAALRYLDPRPRVTYFFEPLATTDGFAALPPAAAAVAAAAAAAA